MQLTFFLIFLELWALALPVPPYLEDIYNILLFPLRMSDNMYYIEQLRRLCLHFQVYCTSNFSVSSCLIVRATLKCNTKNLKGVQINHCGLLNTNVVNE